MYFFFIKEKPHLTLNIEGRKYTKKVKQVNVKLISVKIVSFEILVLKLYKLQLTVKQLRFIKLVIKITISHILIAQSQAATIIACLSMASTDIFIGFY